MTRKGREGNHSSPPQAAPVTQRKLLWWRATRGGRPKAREELLSLPPGPQGELAARIDRYLKNESRPREVDHLWGDLYEIRYSERNNHYRVIFFIWHDYFVALTVFFKNQRKTPKVDLDRAKSRRKTWIREFGE